MVARPRTITQIAEEHDLHVSEVRVLIRTHAVPTYRLGRCRLVGPEDWPTLESLLVRYAEAKRREARSSV
jgi:hypothetical protein